MSELTPKKERPNGSERYALEWAEVFLTTLRATGNVRLSCHAAGISRVTAYKARDRLATFRQQWDEALEDAIDMLEAEARKRALAISDTLLIFLLKAHRPALYSDRIRIDMEIRKAAEDTKRVLEEAGFSPGEVMREVEAILSASRGKH